MDKKVKHILQYLFWTAVTVALVWFCIKAIDWEEFLAALQECKWGYVLAAFLTGCIIIAVRGLRWHMLIKPLDPSITKTDVVNAYGIGFVANIVLPRLGEVVKIGYLVKDSATGEDGKKRLSWDAAIGTYLAEKSVDAVVLLICTAVFLVNSWNVMKDNLQIKGGAMGWVMAAVIILSLAFVLMCRSRRERGGIWGKTWNFVCGIGRGLSSIGRLERPWLFILYTASIWFSFWLTSAFTVWALNGTAPFTSLTGASAYDPAIAGCLSALIPVPGGFGAYHGAVATVMQALYGIPMRSGLIYATLNHETQLLAQTATGLWCYISQTFFRK